MIRPELDALHAQIRKVLVAGNEMKMMRDRYQQSPDDYTATQFHAAWCELRAAVDQLVALPRLDVDHFTLAAYGEAIKVPGYTVPEGTES